MRKLFTVRPLLCGLLVRQRAAELAVGAGDEEGSVGGDGDAVGGTCEGGEIVLHAGVVGIDGAEAAVVAGGPQRFAVGGPGDCERDAIESCEADEPADGGLPKADRAVIAT